MDQTKIGDTIQWAGDTVISDDAHVQYGRMKGTHYMAISRKVVYNMC